MQRASGAVTGWTVFAYDQADGYWLTETYGATVGVGSGPQIPEPPATLLMLFGCGCIGLIAYRRRSAVRDT